MREARLYRSFGSYAKCLLCWRLCKIEKYGFCRSRIFKEGKLYTLTYGNISALESRPMEIKPFFHFKPGDSSLTFSSYSCNLDCPWCQNWHLSKVPPKKEYEFVSPEKLVEMALRKGDNGVCASFNEPTLLFEYLLDLFPLAKKKNLHTTIVSNGYMTIRALEMLRKAGLDGMNVDVKGSEKVYEMIGGKARLVWKVVKFAKKLGIHVEVVNLVISNLNDREEDFEWIVENHLKFAGEDVPIHFTRYFPAYLFTNPPTKIERLEKAAKIARREGIKFVYIGNVPGHEFENTYCPECGELLVKRYSYRVLENKIVDGKCFNCGTEIYGVF